jgi:hypothetical protein
MEDEETNRRNGVVNRHGKIAERTLLVASHWSATGQGNLHAGVQESGQRVAGGFFDFLGRLGNAGSEVARTGSAIDRRAWADLTRPDMSAALIDRPIGLLR